MAKASCCCGSLIIEVTGQPSRYGVCHCENCQKRTGSAFGISTYFDSDQIVGTSGKHTVNEFKCEQSTGVQKRYFCSKCGTTLYWEFSKTANSIGIAGGCFESGYLGIPEYSVSNNQKADWLPEFEFENI